MSAQVLRNHKLNQSQRSLRENLLFEVCKNDDELLERTKKRLQLEKKEHENKLVKRRLQSKITTMFSSKNLSPHGAGMNNLPYEMNAMMRRVDTEAVPLFGNLNNLQRRLKHSDSRDDLDQIINIHANKQSVGAKKHDKYVNNQIAETQMKKHFEAEMRAPIIDKGFSQYQTDSEF